MTNTEISNLNEFIKVIFSDVVTLKHNETLVSINEFTTSSKILNLDGVLFIDIFFTVKEKGKVVLRLKNKKIQINKDAIVYYFRKNKLLKIKEKIKNDNTRKH